MVSSSQRLDDGEDFFASSPPQTSSSSSRLNGGNVHISPTSRPALFRGDDDNGDELDDGSPMHIPAQKPANNMENGSSTIQVYNFDEEEVNANANAKRATREGSKDDFRELKKPKFERENSHDSAINSSSSGGGGGGGEGLGEWDRRFLGTFIVPAWSLSKGPNYVQQGDRVKIQRQKPKHVKESTPQKQGKAIATGKKQTKLSFGGAGAGSSAKKTKQKEDYVVRFSNIRGFEVGRIPTEISVWMSKLIDQDIAEFEGFVVDCPKSLTVGCDLLLEIKGYFLRAAFPASLSEGVSFVNGLDGVNGWGAETAETADEKKLRERKMSLVRLFRACTLRPSLTNDILKSHRSNGDLGSDAMMEQFGGEAEVLGDGSGSSTPPPKSKPSSSSDDVVIDIDKSIKPQATVEVRSRSATPEENDGTELNEMQLENVYSKAQLYDPALPEVDPVEAFALTLRPYQKQALGWMLMMEERSNTKGNGPRELSLHPLWEEYRFPVDDERMDLLDTATGAFYFNPYTGDLSLKFQHASRGARGGILADEMGLGKTIQMAALIVTNQPTMEEIEEDDHHELEQQQDHGKKYRQMSLATSFAAAGTPSASNGADRRKALLKTSASRGKVTLVVAPMSLIGQWRDELERAIPNMSCMLYYAESKGDLLGRMEGGSVDVVITSYGTLVTEYKRFIDSGSANSKHLAINAPLYAVEWLRVILDEAHHVKNRATKNSRACCDLFAKRRWCLTGTPIVNRLTDLYSLLRFLKVEPWGDFSFFNSFISKPFAQKNPRALEIVQVVLESVLMRREKKMKDKDGRPIVELPPKVTNVMRLKFSPLERKIYESVYDRAYMQYQTLAAAGTITRNFSFIFSVLMRLRQAVCHPMLVLKGSKRPSKGSDNAMMKDEVEVEGDQSSLGDKEDELKRLIADFQAGNDRSDAHKAGGEAEANALSSEALEELIRQQSENDEDFECPFCFEEKSEMCYLPCKHMGCRSCLMDHLQRCEVKDEEPSCPTCRTGPVFPTQFFSAVRTRPRKNHLVEAMEGQGREGDSAEEIGAPPSSQNSQPAVFFRRNNFRSSTKLEALVNHLNELRYEDPSFKGVIFSQFTSFLDLVEVVLRKNHHPFVRLDGTTSQKDREAVLKEFSNAPKRMLMLISLRAGGVGLNLVAANHVWLLDCWWNTSTEDQAVDRIHRLGQTREVHVHRFIIDESIEDRILAIQARKSALVGAALAGTRGPDEKSEALQNLELLFG